MLAICTDWQMRNPETLNDHADPAYDAKVIDRLGALHEDVRPICSELGRTLDRFGPYAERLSGALERVRAGEHDWFTGVRIPSYHSVWFELHENLLATLGIDRSREPT
jgi:pyruvate,orthophosphate dikinase